MTNTLTISITGGLKSLALMVEPFLDVIHMIKVGNFIWNVNSTVVVTVISIVLLWIAFGYYKNKKK